MNKWRCETCIHYQKTDEDYGTCHRYPPVPKEIKKEDLHPEVTAHIHPVVTARNYCGEWREAFIAGQQSINGDMLQVLIKMKNEFPYIRYLAYVADMHPPALTEEEITAVIEKATGEEGEEKD